MRHNEFDNHNLNSSTNEKLIQFDIMKARKLFHAAYSAHLDGDIELAITLYQESIKWHPTAESYTFYAWALSFSRQYEQAIELCKCAIELNPNYGNPLNDMGAYLIELGRSDEAVYWLKKAIMAKDYDCKFYPYYNLGRIFEEQKQIKKAIGCFEKALEINPDFEAAEQEIARLNQYLN